MSCCRKETVGYPISGIKLAEKIEAKFVIINGRNENRSKNNNSQSGIIEAEDCGTDFTVFFFSVHPVSMFLAGKAEHSEIKQNTFCQ